MTWIVCSLFAIASAGAVFVFDRPYDMAQTLSLALLALILCLVRAAQVLTVAEGLTALGLASLSLLLPTLPLSFVLIGLGVALGFLFSDLNSDQRVALKGTLIALGLFESLIAWLSYFHLDNPLFRQLNGAPIGTVGNPDFLASLIAAGILSLDLRAKGWRHRIAFVALAVGLVATKSRGTMALTALLLFYPYIPNIPRRWWWLGAPIALAAIAAVRPELDGRVQLWLVSLRGIGQRLWNGWGADGFATMYFDTNLSWMRASPEFRARFGGWSSEVSDAHNLPLQWGVEFGLCGILFAAALWYLMYRRLRQSPAMERRTLILLLAKTFYTVVLKSVQGVGLLSFCVSRPLPLVRDHRTRLATALLIISLIWMSTSLLTAARANIELERATSSLRIGLVDEAVSHLQRGLDLEPKNSNLLLAMGFAQMQKRQCGLSQVYVDRAITVTHSMDTYKRGGHILFGCERYQEALHLFRDLHTVFPEHRTTTMKMAAIFDKLGDRLHAARFAREVIEIRPRRQSFSDPRNLSQAQELLNRYRQDTEMGTRASR